MRKTTAVTLTAISLIALIGVSACSLPPVTSENPNRGPENSHEASISPVTGEKIERVSYSTSNHEEIHKVKTLVEGFYISLNDKDKASEYAELLDTFGENDDIDVHEKREQAKAFFAQDLTIFDEDTVDEDTAFKFLNIATIAVANGSNLEKVTVPLDSIIIEGNKAFIDLDDVLDEDNDTFNFIELTKKDGTWFISSFPGSD